MLNIPSILLIFTISSGQLIKIPMGTGGGLTLLDLNLIALSIYGSFKVKYDFKNVPSWIKFAFVFISIAILSLVFTPLELTPIEFFTSLAYIIRFSLFIFFAMLLHWGAFPQIINNISKIVIYSGIVLAILGFLQLAILPDLSSMTIAGWDPHYFRMVSTFLDPNFFGSFMSLSLILIVQTLKKYQWNIFIFSLIFIALLTTFSRGAYLGFAVGFLTLSILRKSVKFFMLTVFLCLILGLGFITYQNIVAAPRNIDRTKSAQYRLNSYQQGLTIFQKHPIFGVGFNAYRFALEKYNLGDEQFLQSHGASTNDSSLIYVAATTGVIGLLSFLFFLLLLFKTAWKKFLQKKQWGLILIAGLSALFVQSFFTNTLFYPFLLIPLILIATKNSYKE